MSKVPTPVRAWGDISEIDSRVSYDTSWHDGINRKCVRASQALAAQAEKVPRPKSADPYGTRACLVHNADEPCSSGKQHLVGPSESGISSGRRTAAATLRTLEHKIRRHILNADLERLRKQPLPEVCKVVFHRAIANVKGQSACDLDYLAYAYVQFVVAVEANLPSDASHKAVERKIDAVLDVYFATLPGGRLYQVSKPDPFLLTALFVAAVTWDVNSLEITDKLSVNYSVSLPSLPNSSAETSKDLGMSMVFQLLRSSGLCSCAACYEIDELQCLIGRLSKAAAVKHGKHSKISKCFARVLTRA
eukprot:CAMPEP_0177610284 /NCGR_PEP_ID=MMETSP0419_2-20121207/19674_1 /TAXON_ID=582737 /ORGANISM="Tetraselmis sp., Strain GSL018" /LENGTH=304 /DNA_ID=CAMNT_0019105533 /DNA_START=34 /DNA_END=948 /DNA_ORIENTATION=+